MILRNITLNDLERYDELTRPHMLHHQFNGPYFGIITDQEHKAKIEKLKSKLNNKEAVFQNRKMIDIDGCIVGEVSWYWKSKETNWMEIGILVFDDSQWGKGIGEQALRLWIDLLFEEHPELVRIGLTTWSGNPGMMKLSEKIGLEQEACYRKARTYKGDYYDSVSYGVLKENWCENA